MDPDPEYFWPPRGQNTKICEHPSPQQNSNLGPLNSIVVKNEKKKLNLSSLGSGHS